MSTLPAKPTPVEGISPHDAEVIDSSPQLDAYALLTKPTLQLTDAEVDRIIDGLRKRRLTHLSTQKPDKPKAQAKAAKAVVSGTATPADKKANTKALMADLGLDDLLKDVDVSIGLK